MRYLIERRHADRPVAWLDARGQWIGITAFSRASYFDSREVAELVLDLAQRDRPSAMIGARVTQAADL